ncbi:MAG TPA: carboxypeptidase regulatory-like domain-containing protein [Verrucomicrobiae bacterium]|nr:carboxypeptidase regulatory-like domain-containing protein [Verrucomicrobiae bacterium]
MTIRRFLTAFLLFHAAVEAQSSGGAITGVVTDAAWQPIAKATVQLTEAETGRRRSILTDSQGGFTISNLPPGAYRIEAEREGYRQQVQQLTLQLNQELQIEIPLVAGQRTETVEVTAVAGLLRTETAALGGVIDNRQITGLPLDGRDFFELSLLLPGVAPAAPGSAGSARGDFAININGAREDSNNFVLDGVFNGDPKLNGIGVTPPVDAVREFEVATSTYDATYGRNAGGQVNVVLKGGANQVHGTAYEFLRNDVTDARNFFAAPSEPSPQYQRNQFGGSAGGPLVRNRTFFFGDYEGRRVREGITQVTNVPTALERAGNFSQSSLYAIDPFAQQPFPGNVIPQNRLDPIGLKIAALYPLPNRGVPGQNFVSSPVERDRDDHFDLRLDHSLGAKDQLSGRYSFGDRTLYEPFSTSSLVAVPGYGNNVPRRAQNAVASDTHTFTPNLLNEVRAGFNRISAGVFQQNMSNNLNQQVGLPTVSSNARDNGLSLISVLGYSPLGDESNNPQHSATSIYQVSDALTWARGKHLVRAGVDLRWLQQNAFRDEEARGFLTFLGETGNALAEMLLGLPSLTGVAKLDNAEHLRSHSAYGFVQDTWRLRPDLTVIAGLRYEYNSPPADAFDRASLYDPATQSLVQVGTGNIPRGGSLPDRNNFAPTLGLAWRPGRSGTTVRAGYGLHYDQSSLAPGEGLYFSPPYFNFNLYFPFGQIPLALSNPFPANFPIPVPSSALAMQKNLTTPYIQQWNVNVQHELGRDRVVELAYVGSKGTKLLGARDLNQPFPSAQPVNPRPVPQFADIDILESRADSNYNSLQARFQQRFQHGLTALASYTWSKSIDDASSFFSSSGDANFPQNSYDTRAERGLSNFDLRHRFSLSYSYDLPFGKGALRGGWQTFGIWTFQTGRPFTVALDPNVDNSNTGQSILGFGANDRPNLLRPAALSNPTPDRWFDVSAFALPPFGSFGNAGRNILTGPGFQSVNVSLVKNLRFAERASLQIRGEVFNLFNHPNFDLPNIFFGTPAFGAIQSAESPRRIQFGAKILF